MILLAGIPAVEIVIRKLFGTSIRGGFDYTRHIVLWLTLLGASVNSFTDRHMKIEFCTKFLPERGKKLADMLSLFVVILVSGAFFIISLVFLKMGFTSEDKVGFISQRLIMAVMPLGFLLVIIRTLQQKTFSYGAVVTLCAAVLAALWLAFSPAVNCISDIVPEVPEWLWSLADMSVSSVAALRLPLILVLICSGVLGTPIFAVLGGIAYILITASGTYAEISANEFYTMLIGNTVPAIPLFTLTGFILSESKAGDRLIRTFNAFFGWMPAGIIIASVVISAFFTVFTGASGVTILAIGGLLAAILEKNGIEEKYRDGLLCSAGSIGLLFPPSLPMILYGIIAQLDIKAMFLGGIVPGLLLVLSLVVTGVFYISRHPIRRVRSTPHECVSSFIGSFWEFLLPFIIIFSYFSGLTTLVETGAVAVLYTMLVEFVIKRELHVKDLFTIAQKSVPIIAGILVILGMAKVLSYYMIDEMIPQRFAEWTALHIHSKILFLFLLNIALLVVGCFMDIYSAIMVVVPLITPLGEIFGINPVHLGIIFLANLELGYLTPPVGLNLFLASYRFNVPLEKMYRAVIPFFLIMLLTVFIITYVPGFTLCLIK